MLLDLRAGHLDRWLVISKVVRVDHSPIQVVSLTNRKVRYIEIP